MVINISLPQRALLVISRMHGAENTVEAIIAWYLGCGIWGSGAYFHLRLWPSDIANTIN